jgi:hypothetical protein
MCIVDARLPPANPIEALFAPPKARGRPEQAFAAAAVRHAGEYYVPIEHHKPDGALCLDSDLRWQRQAHGL